MVTLARADPAAARCGVPAPVQAELNDPLTVTLAVAWAPEAPAPPGSSTSTNLPRPSLMLFRGLPAWSVTVVVFPLKEVVTTPPSCDVTRIGLLRPSYVNEVYPHVASPQFVPG